MAVHGCEWKQMLVMGGEGWGWVTRHGAWGALQIGGNVEDGWGDVWMVRGSA